MATNLVPIGSPLGEVTPEIKLKALQTQIAERKLAIKNLEIEKEGLTTVSLPRIEGLILTHESAIKHLIGLLDGVTIIDV